MAAPVAINELSAAGSLSAGAVLVVYQGNDTVRSTPGDIVRFVAVTPEMDGAVGDGVTDDSTAWTTALARISGGGTLMCKPGAVYKFASQVTVTGPANDRIQIFGHGAEIQTSGAISGLKITGGDSTGGVTVHGLRINHRGNATATYGFDILQSWRARLYDCFVEAHGVSGTYAAYHVANATAADDSTGSFWTSLINCGCRKRSGADSGDITYGVLLEGAANATRIVGGDFNNVTTGVKIQNHTAQTTVANGVAVLGASFETFGTGIQISGAAASNLTGHSFSNNRFEDGTTVFSITGVTTQPANPPIFGPGNQFTADAGTYLSNTNSLNVCILDAGAGSDIQGQIVQNKAFKIKTLSGSEHGLDVQPGGGNRGVLVRTNGGSASLNLSWFGVGTQAKISSQNSNELFVGGVKGISNSTTNAENLRGSATFATAASVAVTFATAEPNSTYFISISGSANETYWVTSKGTGGFTLNSSNASSTATVDWHLIR